MFFTLLKSTAKSFIELLEYLFTVEGVKLFFSERLCQDPIENYFGCQRQRGGTHDNPTVKEFKENEQALRVVNSFCRPVVKGNCRGNTTLSTEQENKLTEPLPRRPKSKTKCKS